MLIVLTVLTLRPEFEPSHLWWQPGAYALIFNIPVAIWLIGKKTSQFPRLLEDAARIDGCSPFRLFHQIVFPWIRSTVVWTFLLCLLFTWNVIFFTQAFATNLNATVTDSSATLDGLAHNPWGEAGMNGLLIGIPFAILVCFVANRMTSSRS
jgi:multiple sugar transport system permease protein